ncbi:MAG: nitroreductase [Actinomycetia bacterium]|nr:nitroreductase [Actinomycetes bacterium]
MTDNSIFSVIGRQRACRAYSDEPVPDDVIAQVLRAATFAPSAENHQPWEFIVVRDSARRSEIARLMQRAWEDYGRAFSEPRSTPKLLTDVHRGMTGGFATAPVWIVVAADLDRTLDVTVQSSIYPAVQNLLLAATALGLGSALTTIATLAEELATLLALPNNVQPVAVVPLGYPARPLAPPKREPFEAHTHRETYDTNW